MDRAKKIVCGLFVLMFLGLNLYGEQVEVTADNFFADENKLFSNLSGNVIIKKGAYDTLTANSAKIFFDTKKQPTKYEAHGNAKFKVILKDKHYDGSGDLLIYEPNKQIYTLSGNAYLHEVETDKKVYGDKISVDQIAGTYNVSSSDSGKKPVKLIFQVEDKKK